MLKIFGGISDIEVAYKGSSESMSHLKVPDAGVISHLLHTFHMV